MKLDEIFDLGDRFAKFKADRETVPIPPKTNLYHVTLAHNWPSIKQQGFNTRRCM